MTGALVIPCARPACAVTRRDADALALHLFADHMIPHATAAKLAQDAAGRVSTAAPAPDPPETAAPVARKAVSRPSGRRACGWCKRSDGTHTARCQAEHRAESRAERCQLCRRLGAPCKRHGGPSRSTAWGQGMRGPKARKKGAGMAVHAERKCRRCGTLFTPTGPSALYCADHRRRSAAKTKARKGKRAKSSAPPQNNRALAPVTDDGIRTIARVMLVELLGNQRLLAEAELRVIDRLIETAGATRA